jgi:hypothetical protein
MHLVGRAHLARVGLAAFACLAVMLASLLFSAPARANHFIRPGWFPWQLNPAARIMSGVPKADALVSTPATGCRPGPNFGMQGGTYLLLRYLQYHYSRGELLQGYSCRRIANSPYWSLHAEGRANDFHLEDTDWSDLQIGNHIFEWFLRTVSGKPAVMARRWGVQEIIWRCAIWSVDRGLHYYEPCRTTSDRTLRHENHIHIGQNPYGAGGYTTAYTGYWPNH